MAATTVQAVAPTTVPTVVPTTETPPPTPTTTASPAELLPGFASTDDLDQFIEQLRDGDSVAGRASKKLGDKLRSIDREDDVDKRAERIDKLREDIGKWIADDQLDPIVADRAAALLDDLEIG